MRLGKLQAYFDNSPALRLLRSQNAPYVIDFLDRQFKQSSRIAIPQAELLSALIAYQEDVQESHPGHFAAKAAFTSIGLASLCRSITKYPKPSAVVLPTTANLPHATVSCKLASVISRLPL